MKFVRGLGDLLVGRIAGNFADGEMLGSMKFATKVAGSKVIVVMAHEVAVPLNLLLPEWSWGI